MSADPHRRRSHRRTTVLGWISLGVVLALLAACGSSAGSSVADPTAAAPTVSSAWARPAAAGGQSAAYFDITGDSSGSDTLLSASSPAAGMVEVHETTTDATGMTGMQPVERVDVPAGGTVSFKPGGYHLMLMNLAQELVIGQSIELDLVFEKGGPVVVTAEIRQS